MLDSGREKRVTLTLALT